MWMTTIATSCTCGVGNLRTQIVAAGWPRARWLQDVDAADKPCRKVFAGHSLKDLAASTASPLRPHRCPHKMGWCSMQSLTQPHQRGHLSSSARPRSASSFSGVSSSIDAHLSTAGCSAAGAFGAKRASTLLAVANSRWFQQRVNYTQTQARLVAVWERCRSLLSVTCDLLNVQHSCYSL